MWKKWTKTPPNEIGGLLPLDEIRQEEAKITSHLIQARQQAEAIRVAAAQQAEQLKRQAVDDGTRDGQKARASRYAETQKQADQIIAQAHAAAEELAVKTGDQVESAVAWAENLVFGLKQRGGNDEP